MANEDAYNSTDSDNFATQDGLGNSYGITGQGHTPALGSIKGVIRFPSIPINQGVTVDYAMLYFYVENNGGDGGTLRTKVYGIDEDNTGVLTGDPFGRPSTTAVTAKADTEPSVGSYNQLGVTDQVNEILARSGWSNGNAMGFHIVDDGTLDTNWMSDQRTGNTFLLIRVIAQPDFTPTNGSISAPTFPVSTDYGIKISEPGVDVLDATETQLYFSTRKKTLRVLLQAQADISDPPQNEITVAHNLGYTPCILGYRKTDTFRYKINEQWATPLNIGSYIRSDSTNLYVSTEQASTVYYYCFLDPLT